MPRTVNVHEAKTHFSRLLDEVHGGGEVIIAKAGRPYARLVPLARARAADRIPGGLEGRLPPAFFEPLAEEELGLWEGN